MPRIPRLAPGSHINLDAVLRPGDVIYFRRWLRTDDELEDLLMRRQAAMEAAQRPRAQRPRKYVESRIIE